MKYQFKNSDVYDIEACQPILEILEKHFLDIEFAHNFQEGSLNMKKGRLLDIALEIEALNNISGIEEAPQFKGTLEALDKITIRV